jgi:diadenosine tetraphosphate (Ap4A) HIT family hydrolase
MGCELCAGPGGRVLWQNGACRVVAADDPDYPGFCRVIANRHAREVTDLPPEERDRLMQVVYAVEAAVREAMQPHKVNIASLGNETPHVHWHVIPRFEDDRHFPKPVWAPPERPASGNGDRAKAAHAIGGILGRMLGGGQG